MGRNIVLFSDGTGNKGGTGSNTNVFNLYNAIKGGRQKPGERKQIAFYDNGVGTSSHAVARAIGGATGSGFRQNVRDLYEFLGRHYKDGNDIYGFGFSRGAATVRAFAGMVHHCGLVRKHTGRCGDDGNEVELDEVEFQRQVDAAMATYVRRCGGISLRGLWEAIAPPDLKYDRHQVKIEFLGVWDTVAALGFPQIWLLDFVVNLIRRHRFYDYEPTAVVNHVFQAVAVDDERRTFWPLIWDETGFADDQHIEQVWFSGVHSNVGGGYPREGLANITLDWMIARLKGHRNSIAGDDRGLVLEKDFPDEVRNGISQYGKLYDSRAGFALLYRYQPRPIKELCTGRLRGNGRVRIHSSVLDRMKRRTAGYGPGQLPDSFDEVETHGPEGSKEPALYGNVVQEVDMNETAWTKIRSKIDGITGLRIGMYWAFLATTVALLAVSFSFWIGWLDPCGFENAWRAPDWVVWVLGHVADVLQYFLPDFFNNIITFGILEQPWWGGGLFGLIGLYYWLRCKLRCKSNKACETARGLVLRKARPA
jgi:uncharacterized protein (DUF2235 family)